MANKRIAALSGGAADWSANAPGFAFDSDDYILRANVDGTQRPYACDHVVTLDAAYTVSEEESGTTFVLSATTEFAVTLPAPAAGLKYTFIVGAAPSSASYTVVTNGGSAVIHGLAVTSDVNTAAADADATAGTAADTITFVDSKAVVGDRAELVSDGTNWYATAFCKAADGITFTAS
jgi:hypothetical protein